MVYVRAALLADGCRMVRRPASTSAEVAEQIAEQIGEAARTALLEDEIGKRDIALWAALLLSLLIGLPKAVVLLALFGIAEHLIGLTDFLEALLSGLITRIDVRMMLAGQLAVGLLYLFL